MDILLFFVVSRDVIEHNPNNNDSWKGHHQTWISKLYMNVKLFKDKSEEILCGRTY